MVNITWAEVEQHWSAGANPENDCLTCGDGIPGTLAPMATNGDTWHPWVERCDECGRFDSDWTAAQHVAARTGLVARKRFDDAGMIHFHPFLAVPGSPDDHNFYCIDADEFGTHPRDEVSCR